MSNQVLTAAQITEICQRRKAGETASSIGRAFGVSANTVNYHYRRSLSVSATPKEIRIPNGYLTVFDAVLDYGHCANLGIDSEQSVAFCRSKNVKLTELKAFGEWMQKNALICDKEDIKLYKGEISGLRNEVAQLTAAREKDNEALAEYGRQQLIARKELAQNQKMISQLTEEAAFLKKLQAILAE